MPSDEYTSVSRGGLKLKGASSSKISKKKKKPKPSVESEEGRKSALAKVVEDEDEKVRGKVKDGEGEGEMDRDGEENEMRELDPRDGDGKTASERAQEEMRRRRVSSHFPHLFPFYYSDTVHPSLHLELHVLPKTYIPHLKLSSDIRANENTAARQTPERGRQDPQAARGGTE